LQKYQELIRASKLVDTLINAGEESNYLHDNAKVTTTLLELEIDASVIRLKAEFTSAFFKANT
jgi:SHS2 domain-containing protein